VPLSPSPYARTFFGYMCRRAIFSFIPSHFSRLFCSICRSHRGIPSTPVDLSRSLSDRSLRLLAFFSLLHGKTGSSSGLRSSRLLYFLSRTRCRILPFGSRAFLFLLPQITPLPFSNSRFELTPCPSYLHIRHFTLVPFSFFPPLCEFE